MELKFTGIGAAYYPVLGSNCAFFEHDNCLYLIDCGESTFRAISNAGIVLQGILEPAAPR